MSWLTPGGPPHEGLVYTARLNPRDIAYVVSLVEAHEGLAVVRTKDAASGIVEFWISPLMRQDFESFLEALGREIGLTVREPEVQKAGLPPDGRPALGSGDDRRDPEK